MDDASLDEFLDDEDENEDGEASDPDPDPDPGDGNEDDEGDPSSTVSTYEFSPDGADCARCGDEVLRRWRDDGALVCESCKRWG